jgi:hypothetical protein
MFVPLRRVSHCWNACDLYPKLLVPVKSNGKADEPILLLVLGKVVLRDPLLDKHLCLN